MVITLSSLGIKLDSAFKKVVLPEPVPPLINILYPAMTSFSKKQAASSDIEPISINFFMVMGLSGNFLIVTTGPSSATGGRTILTLEPSGSLASTIGLDSFIIRFDLDTICCTTSSNFFDDSNCFFHGRIAPFCSINILFAPLIMISVMEVSSTSSCNISNLRMELNISFLSLLLSCILI